MIVLITMVQSIRDYTKITNVCQYKIIHLVKDTCISINVVYIIPKHLLIFNERGIKCEYSIWCQLKQVLSKFHINERIHISFSN